MFVMPKIHHAAEWKSHCRSDFERQVDAFLVPNWNKQNLTWHEKCIFTIKDHHGFSNICFLNFLQTSKFLTLQWRPFSLLLSETARRHRCNTCQSNIEITNQRKNIWKIQAKPPPSHAFYHIMKLRGTKNYARYLTMRLPLLKTVTSLASLDSSSSLSSLLSSSLQYSWYFVHNSRRFGSSSTIRFLPLNGKNEAMRSSSWNFFFFC